MDDHYRVLAQKEMQNVMKKRRESAERVANSSSASHNTSRDILSPPVKDVRSRGGVAGGKKTLVSKRVRYFVYLFSALALVHFLLTNIFFRALLSMADDAVADTTGGGNADAAAEGAEVTGDDVAAAAGADATPEVAAEGNGEESSGSWIW